MKQQLLSETAKIEFEKLQRFFATGQAVYVEDSLDLIDTAASLSLDAKDTIEALMAENKIAKVTDQQAKDWLKNDAIVWAVVVKPWVLIQNIKL